MNAALSSRRLPAESYETHFSDLHPAYTERQALVASQHCLYCYDAPCVKACPSDVDVPTFIRKIASGNVVGAGQTILDNNILGGTCARACPTEVLCEQACVRNKPDDTPVKIGNLQRYAVDALMDECEVHPFARAALSGKKIAVIGAGPAGLSCAHRLSTLGHDVTIFEAKEKSGGLNEYGLAAYKMVDDFAQKEVEFILAVGGITVKHGVGLGRDIQLNELMDTYDAVFLGVGLGDARQLSVPGEELDGVYDAIDFISELRQANPADVAVGDRVIVIGGGNTAIDAAIQAKRLGAKEVQLVYRRGPEHMAATAFERSLAKNNDIIFRCWSSPVEIQGNGAVQSMTFERTSIGDDGRVKGLGETYAIDADMVLKAVGQTLSSALPDDLKLASGKIAIDEEHRTSLKGVYAGGDCILRGEDLTVRAVEDGKRAAHTIHNDLQNG